jgi:methyltransferase (TIGR00027 family)
MPDAGVPDTAFLTALARAEATADPRGRLRDPYAARFAEHCPSPIRRITRHTAGTSVVVARTLLIDRLLSAVLADGQAEVCVNLGAGFDARPFRLPWPAGCRVIEVDCAAVLDLKDQLLPSVEATVPLERLRCDLADLPALSELLLPHMTGRRTVFLAEGLLTYFPPAHTAALAAALCGLGTARTLLCDVLSSASARSLTTAARMAGAPLEMHGLTDLAAFEAAGWRCEQLELLPTARPSAAPAGRLPTGVTGLVPDSVLMLRHHRIR